MQLGATFSHPHLKWLGLSPEKAIKEYKKLGLTWVRLGCYWNEIEKAEGKFDFSELDNLIKYCENNDLKVILTVGMKAPRWPEYYIPDWLEKNLNFRKLSKIQTDNHLILEKTLNFIEKTVINYLDYNAISAWQLENEPLDPSGPKWWRVDKNFLEKEVQAVRALDPNRKVLINLWGNELSKRKTYKKVIEFAEIIGLDLYLKHEFSIKGKFIKYIGPLDSLNTLKKITKEIILKGKSLWITELQAEPWEPKELVTKKENPPSFLPEHFKKNLKYALQLKPEIVILWGFEFWYYRKLKSDLRYWNAAKNIIRKYG